VPDAVYGWMDTSASGAKAKGHLSAKSVFAEGEPLTQGRSPRVSGTTYRRDLLLLMLASLILRLLFWVPVAFYDVQPAYDERAYYLRSEGVVNILNHVIRGRGIDPADVELLYCGNDWFTCGFWPPLQPIFIAAGRGLFSWVVGRVAGARLLTVAVSALTTGLIYLMTARVYTRKAAVFAGAIHALYPSFLASSWGSEACLAQHACSICWSYRCGFSRPCWPGGCANP